MQSTISIQSLSNFQWHFKFFFKNIFILLLHIYILDYFSQGTELELILEVELRGIWMDYVAGKEEDCFCMDNIVGHASFEMPSAIYQGSTWRFDSGAHKRHKCT